MAFPFLLFPYVSSIAICCIRVNKSGKLQMG
jgi:hypothetical protein